MTNKSPAPRRIAAESDARNLLTRIGKESQQNGTDKLTDSQIDQMIESTRKARKLPHRAKRIDA
jgi:hypothetical protein